MANFVFPTSEELMVISQEKLPTLTQDDPIFRHFPIVDRNIVNVRWEQMDAYTGLQQLRGVGGRPQRVAAVGMKSYSYEPGAYGEFAVIDEMEMLERRPMGTWDGFVDLSDLVMIKQDQLLNRRVDRIRWIIWTLVTKGIFAVATPTGGIGHQDQYAIGGATPLGAFKLLSASAAVAWSTVATSTPLKDFRDAKLLARGRSVSFGANATAFMNQSTFNNMIRNTNAADLGGQKSALLTFSSLLTVADINRVLVAADLPTIEIYDGGYIDDTNTFQLFIPTGTIIIIGARTNGAPLGEYIMTRNMVNPGGAAGAYQFVKQEPNEVPPLVEVHDGHNGGPAIYYPSAIIIMTGAGTS